MASRRKLRVLIAKPGLDGHDRGAKIVARVLREAGLEVIYSGLHQQTDAIAAAAVEEDVDIVGLSVLSGAHLAYTKELRERLDALSAHDVAIIVGGVIPPAEAAALKKAGAAEVFPVGTDVRDLTKRVEEVAERSIS